MEQEEDDDVKNQAAAGRVNEVKGKKNVVSALVNALRAGFKKKPIAKEDMEVLNTMKEGSDEEGGLTVPADISTTIKTLRRSEDALEMLVRREKTTKVKGSRVYEVNADSVPLDVYKRQVLMAVSVGAALTKQEIDNVWEKMTIIEQKIEMQEKEKKPEELNKRSDTKWDSKMVCALNASTEEKEKSESKAEESAQSLLHGN